MLGKNTVKIAYRQMRSRKRQTIVSMLGVTFGITVFIIQAGIITGFQEYLIDTIIENSAHIRIYNEPKTDRVPILNEWYDGPESWNVVRHAKPKDEEPKLKRPYQMLELIERRPEVTGASPFLRAQVFFRYGTLEIPGSAEGVDIDRENKLFDLDGNMTVGSLAAFKSTQNGIILGSGLAKKLNSSLGDRILLSSAVGLTLDFKVAGVHESGVKEIDDSRAFITVKNAQKLMGKDLQYITDINIKIRDVDAAGALAKTFERQFGYKALDWKTANERFFTLFAIQNMVTYIVIISILIVSGFGIFNILTMMIYEKMRDVAILKSMGFSNGEVLQIFMTQALIIGFLGGLLGLGLGFVSSYGISQIPIRLEGEITFDRLAVNFSPWFYVSAFCFAMLTTAAAGILPARKAAKIDPVDVIRNSG